MNDFAGKSLGMNCASQCIQKAPEAVPTTSASRLVDLAYSVAGLADATEARIFEKLAPILAPDFPSDAMQTGISDTMPPLFATLADRLEAIRTRLEVINHTLDRVDL